MMNLQTVIRFKTSLVIAFFLSYGSAGQSYADNQSPVSRPHRIEIFVTSWCPYCKKLEQFLKDHRINYIRHDIESDKRAKATLATFGGGGVPLTLIDSKRVIRGFDKVQFCQEIKAC